MTSPSSLTQEAAPELRPLYETIARDLIGAIEDGRYPIGALLPTEAELADSYGVSRQTVRAAMRRLSELGAISRRKGSGTRVERRKQPAAGFVQTLASLDDLVALATATTRDIRAIETVVMDRRAAATLGCAPGSRWIRVGYVRTLAKPRARPIGFVDVYVDERYAEIVESLHGNSKLVSDLIEERFGIVVSRVSQQVDAAALSASQAQALGAEAGSAALRVMRRYHDQTGRLFEISVSVHPQGRYSVTSELRRLG